MRWHTYVTRMRVGCNCAGSCDVAKKSKNGVSAFWIESMMANSMEVVSRLSDFRSCSYSALQHLAIFCNICNILKNFGAGVPRPAESIPDDSGAPFPIVLSVAASVICAIEVLFQCLQRASPGLAQNKNLDEAGHSSVNI